MKNGEEKNYSFISVYFGGTSRVFKMIHNSTEKLWRV